MLLKIPLKIFAPLLVVALASGASAQPKKPRALTAPNYQTELQKALSKLEKVEKREPRDVRTLLKPLDAPITAKRDDGATQKVNGDLWGEARTAIGDRNPAKLTRPQSRDLKNHLRAHVEESRDWTRKRDGAYFQNVDAKKWLSQVQNSGQITVSPPFWERWITDALTFIGGAIKAFFDWLGGLFPNNPAPRVNVGNPTWLEPLFYVCVAGLISFLLFLAIRSLQGKGFTFWRRGRKTQEEMHDADAELFLLPPDELMDRASRFAAEGNFREAVRHRFISLLVFLDGRGVWRYDVRRTNWEHIAQLRRNPQNEKLVAPLSDLTRVFDRVRYGGASCDQNGWEDFKNDAENLESLAGGRKIKLEVTHR